MDCFSTAHSAQQADILINTLVSNVIAHPNALMPPSVITYAIEVLIQEQANSMRNCKKSSKQ